MASCPRCGNDAEYLVGDVFSLFRCEFCGDDIDATDLAPPDDADQTIQRLLLAPATQPRIRYDAQVA
jgi:uncharacterized protein (DUF983 family)